MTERFNPLQRIKEVLNYRKNKNVIPFEEDPFEQHYYASMGRKRPIIEKHISPDQYPEGIETELETFFERKTDCKE